MAYQAEACGPSNIFGPFKHHLFLGCSVVGFTASVGWNEQVSEITVQLVEDTCEAPVTHPKIYYDNLLQRQTTLAADPGFYIYGDGNDAPQIGCAVFFRVETGEPEDTENYRAFEFSGILQSWERADKIDGKNSYSVKVVDPRQILEGAQVIINDYSGPVPTGIYNLFNVYGYLEANGPECDHTDSGGFGGSQASESGAPWNLILGTLPKLTSQIPLAVDVDYSPYGRIIYRYEPSTVGYGVIPKDGIASSTYLLDISELPTAPDYYRLTGTSISIMEMVTQICQESGCDYYVELIPVVDGGTVYKFIKVRVVSRVTQPNYDAIGNFIATSNGTIDASYGRESRNETTSALLIGGNMCAIGTIDSTIDDGKYESTTVVDDDSFIRPFWGIDEDNNIIPTYESSGQNYITLTSATIDKLNIDLHRPLDIESADIFMMEFRYAAKGQDAWLTHIELEETDIYEALLDAYGVTPPIGQFDANMGVMLAGQNMAGIVNPADLVNLRKDANQDRLNSLIRKDLDEDIETIFKFVEAISSEYWGKKFIVKIDDACVRIDPDDPTKVLFSEVPVEGGWTDETTVLGATGALLEALRLDDGRVGPFLKFDHPDSLIDVEKLSSDFGYDASGNIYAKATVEPDFVFSNYEDREGAWAVVSIASSVDRKANSEDDEALRRMQGLAVKAADTTMGAIAKGAALAAIKNQQDNSVGSNDINLEVNPEPLFPSSACLALKSNILTYGPWYSVGPAGLIRIERDEGLTPWDYGTYANMNTAGNARVTAGLTNMVGGETGSITVAGYPSIPLGAELGATFGAGGTQLVENRTISNGDFAYTNLGSWTGLYGPNITNISVNIGISQVTTTYQMRTFTPQFGRFNKYLADRVKQFGPALRSSQRQSLLKSLGKFHKGPSALGFLDNAKDNGKGKGGKDKDAPRGQDNAKNSEQAKSHMVFAAKLVTPTGSGSGQSFSANVHSLSTRGLRDEIGRDSNEKAAFMSLDGLLRPVSIRGEGGLPFFSLLPSTGSSDPSTGYYSGPVAAIPPIITPSGSGYHKLVLNSRYLNPFVNPGESGHGTHSGHDISILNRTTNNHLGIKNGTITGGSADYKSDYRLLALRGPLVMTAWGYDTNGKPIPNSTESSSISASTNLTDRFLDNWLQRSDKWPTGPIDLRFDRQRGVWVSPPANRMFYARIAANINPGSTGAAYLLDGTDGAVNSGGTSLSSSELKIVMRNVTSNILQSGTNSYAYYDTAGAEYWPVGIPRPRLFVRGTLTATLSYGSTSTGHNCTVVGGINGDTGDALASYPINVKEWCLRTGENLPSGTRVGAQYDEYDNAYYVTTYDTCPSGT